LRTVRPDRRSVMPTSNLHKNWADPAKPVQPGIPKRHVEGQPVAATERP
jgi:hypothetical protein